ncbi:NRDE family protein [Paraglaciecola aquimarina]|uniref:NRDE family protein n=1 Tax=Paraglaciecola aquimarina TaxID=1235557 RepID=A0ABU3SZD0_9ALTE|nr:NRDE family protein [Paraglaciecola aquimarina]MDU0355366.1 NRDE family protein [Paraglaciecola aquimarina]
MCILFVAVNKHQDYPLIIAANRDEFFNRETAESAFWPDNSNILAGQDKQAGGTWMGINRHGHIAALTNIRNPERINPMAISRGELVSNYLLNSADNYLQTLTQSKEKYNGYNLLYGKWDNLHVYNNHFDQLAPLHSGIHGLSNEKLDSTWPKMNKGKGKLEDLCLNQSNIRSDALFELLLDSTEAQDEHLPQTGIPIEQERRLSPIFILGEKYGTRSSTILTVDNNQKVNWYERTYNNKAQCVSEQSFHFNIK